MNQGLISNWADITVGKGIKPPVLGSQPRRKFTPLIQILQSDPHFRCCSEETALTHVYYQSQVADVDVLIFPLFSSWRGAWPSRQGSKHCWAFLQGTEFPRSQHTVPKQEQAHTQPCPYQIASFEPCPRCALSPQGSRAAVTVGEGRTWHLTHHFRFEGWLNLSVLQFLPVNSPEESMFPDVSFTFQATAKAFCRMFSH